MALYYSSLLAISAVAFIVSVPYLGFAGLIVASALFLMLGFASYVDIRSYEIPDMVSLGLFPFGAWWSASFAPENFYLNLFGTIIIAALLWIFTRAYKAIRNRDGLGFGDIKLIASSVIWIGLSNVSVMLLLAAASGIVATLIILGKKGSRSLANPIPFGPHLSFAIWIVWLSSWLQGQGVIGMSGVLFS